MEGRFYVPRETLTMKTYDNCPICASSSFRDHMICKDNTGSKDTFSIVQCIECEFTFTNPIPLEENIGRYYESDEYISHSNTNKGLVNFLYQKVRKYTLDKKVALLKQLSKGSKLLDIGCGTGEFLDLAQRHQYKVEGIEPSYPARTQAIENYGLTVNKEPYLALLPSNSFDYITMWHVLEHVYHLNDRMAELKRLVKKDGHIIIAVPNRKSYDAQKYQEYWAAYDVPRHLYHFTQKDIVALSEKHGLVVTETLPMKFDSLYVSMLSEKYKNGTGNLLGAFLTGLKSNSVAKVQGGYSSQVYIIKQK